MGRGEGIGRGEEGKEEKGGEEGNTYEGVDEYEDEEAFNF